MLCIPLRIGVYLWLWLHIYQQFVVGVQMYPFPTRRFSQYDCHLDLCLGCHQLFIAVFANNVNVALFFGISIHKPILTLAPRERTLSTFFSSIYRTCSVRYG